MSLTVSPIIPLASGPRDHLRVVAGTKEDRVVLVVHVGRMAATLDLDLAGARALRAALPGPAQK